MARNNGENMLWFVAGAAFGAAAALLYAPQSGNRTRRLIVRKLSDGRDALADSSADLVSKSRDLYEKGRRVADDAAELFERGRKFVKE
jgi:gas vesicle protein